jgi:hypothetical protein
MRKSNFPQHRKGVLCFQEHQSLMVPETGIEPVRPLFTKRRILSAPRILRAAPEPAWMLGYWLCIQRAKSVFCALLGRKSPAVLSPITAQHSCGAVGGYSKVL